MPSNRPYMCRTSTLVDERDRVQSLCGRSPGGGSTPGSTPTGTRSFHLRPKRVRRPRCGAAAVNIPAGVHRTRPSMLPCWRRLRAVQRLRVGLGVAAAHEPGRPRRSVHRFGSTVAAVASLYTHLRRPRRSPVRAVRGRSWAALRRNRRHRRAELARRTGELRVSEGKGEATEGGVEPDEPQPSPARCARLGRCRAAGSRPFRL